MIARQQHYVIRAEEEIYSYSLFHQYEQNIKPLMKSAEARVIYFKNKITYNKGKSCPVIIIQYDRLSLYNSHCAEST